MTIKTNKNSGIALVAVLAILVVLAIMAATFVTLMNIENKQSAVQMNSQQLDMLVDSGLEHAKSILTVEEAGTPDQAAVLSSDMPFNSKWITVRNDENQICGRYRIKIEDETAKVNINKAFLTENSKGTGWDTGEINLSHALGISKKSAKRLIDYKYGKNKLPGDRGDDDQNNLILMSDGIDNNANGIIDENDEGINDPKEYTPQHLKGDDLKFMSMFEVTDVLLGDKQNRSSKVAANVMREIPQRATIYSIDKPGSVSLPNEIPADINCVTPRECRKLLIKANADTPFEPNATKQRQLTANIVDYRDENHVLSTLGSTYGVEAICFNEILANDESYTIAADKAGVLQQPANYWKDGYGSEDSGRLIYRVDTLYDALPDDPVVYPSPYGYYYNMDPRKAWRIKVVNKKVEMGNIKQLPDRKIILTFPKVIGKYGKGNPKFEQYFKATAPKDLPGNEPWCKWGQGNTVYSYPSSTYEKHYKEIISILRKLSSADGNRPKLPKNYFQNSYVNVYAWSDDIRRYNPESIGCFKIRSGDQKSITIDNDNVYRRSVKFEEQLKKIGMAFTNCDLSISINSWAVRSQVACVKKANTTFLLRAKRPQSGKYFKILVGRLPKGHLNNNGYPNDMGVSGNIDGGYTIDEKDFNKYWAYNDNKPIKTGADGWMKVMLTSSKQISRKAERRQWLGYFRILAPEVVEMYNASATPISLANWRVICNTGSLATQIGKIRSTAYYDRKLRKRIIDDNPVVQPQGHFYLVNDTELFDGWYGNKDNKWGSAANEEIPVFQMDEQNWGVSYKIKKVKSVNAVGELITLDEKNLNKGTFRGETVKFIDKEDEYNPDSWNNIFAPVLFFDYFGREIKDLAPNQLVLDMIGSDADFKKQVGKSLMVLGLLHSGGIVSLTLKNEYDQVCARTVDYGKVDINEFNVSTEKIDPTKTTWVKRKKPSIGGTENKALNRAMHSHHNDKFFIKNGPYCSVGELRSVSTGNDFERLGGSGNLSKGANALNALSKYMCSSHIRLESCLGDVTRIGWEAAYDEVAKSTLASVTGKKGNWKLNKWEGQTIRFLTGPLRGEKYPIIGNTKNTINLAQKNSKFIPRSAPNRKALKPNIGDKFSIGPGYKTPLCYTRKSGDSAVWTWRNVIPYPGTYNFYIYGLNDAIDTTEFLEENNNASLDVELWNYKDNIYDMIKKRGKYGKQDSFNAGKIKPENISADGSVQMRLTAHNVTEKNTDDKSGKTISGAGGKQSGIAWFNYAVITPVPVLGRVNINTAPARLLSSLPGINAKLANNIYEGIDVNKKKTLKPYKNLGDLFKVKGMTPDIFERCVNILTLDSSVYTIEIEAQTFKTDSDKQITDPNNILSSRKKRFTIELDKRTDGFFDITERDRSPVR